jgi:hypothetical protein
MLQQFMSRIAIFPFGSRPYSCRAFTANSRKAGSNGGGQSTPWVTDFRGVEDVRLIAPCSLTLIYCSLINRLTLAAAFAAAFFMGEFCSIENSPRWRKYCSTTREYSYIN